MKNIHYYALCLALVLSTGTAYAEKKCQVVLSYKDGLLSVANNNCKSEIGRAQPMARIVNGRAKMSEEEGAIVGRVQALCNNGIVDEVVIRIGIKNVLHDIMMDDEMVIKKEPVEDITFVAEVPYDQEDIDAIAVVGVQEGKEETKNIIPTETIKDLSTGEGTFQAGSCDLDIVVLPDRYDITYSGLISFLANAQAIRNYVMGIPPYDEFAGKINWHWPTTVEQMTSQGCETDWDNLGKGICGEVEIYEAGCIECHAPDIYGSYDELYVLINQPDIYAGAALHTCPYPDTLPSESALSYSWGTNKPISYRYIAAHELGHSITHLSDEYTLTDGQGNPLSTEYPVDCTESNCCDSCDNVLYADCDESGASDLLDMAIIKQEFGRTNCYSVPCDGDCNGDGKVNSNDLLMLEQEFLETACLWDREPGCEGCSNGCTYANWYKCNSSCIMDHNAEEFCARCEGMIRTWLSQCFD